MQVMQKIAGGLDTTMAVNALLRQFPLDKLVTLRAPNAEGKIENWINFDLLPQLRPLVYGIMARIEGEYLGHVHVATYDPDESYTVMPMPDMSLYLVPLYATQGVMMFSGESGTMLLPGDVWWIRKDSQVKFQNNSDEPFIVLVVAAAPSSPGTYLPEALS